jgi:hypothetical protein
MAIAYVQKTPSTTLPTTGNTTTITTPAFASVVTSGNIVIAVCSAYVAAGVSAFTFSDSGSHIWYNDIIQISTDNTGKIQIGHCYPTSTSAITVTVTSTKTSYLDLGAFELSGVSTSLVAGGSTTNSATGTTASVSVGVLAGVGNNAYIAGVSWAKNASCTSTAGYTEIHKEITWDFANLDSVYLFSSGNQTPAFTLGSTAVWVAAGVAYVEKSTGGGGASIAIYLNQLRQQGII